MTSMAISMYIIARTYPVLLNNIIPENIQEV